MSRTSDTPPWPALKAFSALLSALLIFSGTPAQKTNIDSLASLLKTNLDDTSRYSVLMKIGVYLNRSKPDSALHYHGAALELATRLNDKLRMGKALHQQGWNHYRLGNYGTTLEMTRRCLSLADTILASAKDSFAINSAKKLRSEAMANMGNVYFSQGNYPRALENYFAALKLSEELKNKYAIAVQLGNVGIVYRSLNDYEKSLSYQQGSLHLFEELNDKPAIARSLGNIGNLYLSLKKFSLALDHYLKALAMANELQIDQSKAVTLGNIGNVYIELKDPEKALSYYRQSLDLNRKIKNRNGEARTLHNLGAFFLQQKKYNESRAHLIEALKLSRTINYLDNVMQVEETFSNLDSATGNYKGALEHYKNFIAARDSITNEENTRKQTQLEMKNEFDKKQAADSIRNVEQVKQEQLKHDQEIAQQRIFTYGGVIGFMLMLVVAGVSFRAYRQKQKANATISEQKLLVEAKQKEILDSIHYAKRIQLSQMPGEKYIERVLRKLN